MSWPYIFDGPRGPIEHLWGVNRWPTLYVIDGKRVIRDKNPANLDEAVPRLLDEMDK